MKMAKKKKVAEKLAEKKVAVEKSAPKKTKKIYLSRLIEVKREPHDCKFVKKGVKRTRKFRDIHQACKHCGEKRIIRIDSFTTEVPVDHTKQVYG